MAMGGLAEVAHGSFAGSGGVGRVSFGPNLQETEDEMSDSRSEPLDKPANALVVARFYERKFVTNENEGRSKRDNTSKVCMMKGIDKCGRGRCYAIAGSGIETNGDTPMLDKQLEENDLTRASPAKKRKPLDHVSGQSDEPLTGPHCEARQAQ